MGNQGRTVIQSDRFSKEAAAHLGYRELDKLLCALDWALSNRPERGMETSHPFIRAVTTDRHGSVYVVYYIYDDIEVELLSFRKIL